MLRKNLTPVLARKTVEGAEVTLSDLPILLHHVLVTRYPVAMLSLKPKSKLEGENLMPAVVRMHRRLQFFNQRFI